MKNEFDRWIDILVCSAPMAVSFTALYPHHGTTMLVIPGSHMCSTCYYPYDGDKCNRCNNE